MLSLQGAKKQQRGPGCCPPFHSHLDALCSAFLRVGHCACLPGLQSGLYGCRHQQLSCSRRHSALTLLWVG